MVVVEKSQASQTFNTVLQFNVQTGNAQAFKPYLGALALRWQGNGLAPMTDTVGPDPTLITKRCIIAAPVVDRVIADAQAIETAYLSSAPVPKL